MTTEVVVMNARGAAIAADRLGVAENGSSVTVPFRAKKLFEISKQPGVLLAIHGDNRIYGRSWTTLIDDYKAQLAQRQKSRLLERVDQYRDDFVSFVHERLVGGSGAEPITPEDEDRAFRAAGAALQARVAGYFRDLWDAGYHLPRDLPGLGKLRASGSPEQKTLIYALVRLYHELSCSHAHHHPLCTWQDRGEIAFSEPEAHAASDLIARNAGHFTDLLDGLRKKIAEDPKVRSSGGGRPVSVDIHHPAILELWGRLPRALVAYPEFTEGYTGLVFAGVGASEDRPTIATATLSSVFLRSGKIELSTPVSAGDGAPRVRSFGEGASIESFITGSSEDLELLYESKALRALKEAVSGFAEKNKRWWRPFWPTAKKALSLHAHKIAELHAKVRADVRKHQIEYHEKVLRQSVDVMQPQSLGYLAERITSMTLLKTTTAVLPRPGEEDVDVAVVTKADGVKWIVQDGRRLDKQ